MALTTGGQLAELARAEGVPVIGVPAGMQPRAAVVYMTVGVLECAALCGAAPALHAEIDTAAALLGELAEEWGPDAPRTPRRRHSRRQLQGTMPVVHGAGPTAAPARRWKTQLNENAKARRLLVASCPRPTTTRSALGSAGAARLALAGVFLEDPDQHPRVRRRIELTAAEAQRAGAPAIRVTSRGDTPLERVLSLVLLGDLVSVYLAVLDGVDPTPGGADRSLQGSALRTNLDTIVVRLGVAWRGSRSTRPRRPPAGRRECCATSRAPA